MPNTSSEYKVGITEIRQIIDVVNLTYKFDFSHYAISSFQRRIVRILRHYKLHDVSELVVRLRKDKPFYDDFLEEITVNTTEMFRDPGMWRALRDSVIEKLKIKDTIRIWHAGCSSGEEVFSMTILLEEAGLLRSTKIIATDINNKVIDNAKHGGYTPRNMSDYNQPNYERFGGLKKLSDYSTQRNGMIRLNGSLLRKTTFQVHNLASNVPIGKFDIILCRNVMIYFDKVLQDQVFHLFHNSLNSNGYLVIGGKESMIWSSVSDKFKITNEKEKIYQRRD